MRRTVGGVLALLLALPALAADDKPKDNPTPEQLYKALLKEEQDAVKAYQDALRQARTPEARRKVIEEKAPRPDGLAPRFLELAEKNAKDPVAFDALVWVATHPPGGASGKDSPQARAVTILLRDHVESEKLGPVCQRLSSATDKESGDLLRGILAGSPHRDVQGEACLSLARALKRRVDRMPESQAKDADRLRKECEELYERAADKYADVKFGRGTVGDLAKSELYELRFLSVGKEAPEIAGEDIDGKKFKLSDYRGKVVLLDFWGDW